MVNETAGLLACSFLLPTPKAFGTVDCSCMLNLQLRGQLRVFTGFPFHPPVADTDSAANIEF